MTRETPRASTAVEGAEASGDTWRSDAAQAGAAPPEEDKRSMPSSGSVAATIARNPADTSAEAELAAGSPGAAADAAAAKGEQGQVGQ